MRSTGERGESARRKTKGRSSGTGEEAGADGTRLGTEQSSVGKVE